MTYRMQRIIQDYDKAFLLFAQNKTQTIELHINYNCTLAILYRITRKENMSDGIFLEQTSYKGELENTSGCFAGEKEIREFINNGIAIIFGKNTGGLEKRSVSIFVAGETLNL